MSRRPIRVYGKEQAPELAQKNENSTLATTQGLHQGQSPASPLFICIFGVVHGCVPAGVRTGRLWQAPCLARCGSVRTGRPLVGEGGSPTPRMGPCNSGYWLSPSASPVGVNGRRRCCGSQGRVPGGACIFAPFIWSATACLLKRLLVLLEALHCSYLRVQKSARRRASFLGTHNTFWRSSLPRRALQT